ncbi:MAG: DEAD/DEAH box helicase [Methanolinea sp.]|nr:DEAD/DEAH box helicase [Methanolinea sp.]
MSVSGLLRSLQDDPRLAPGVVHVREISCRGAEYGPAGASFSPEISGYLESRHIRLYTHQQDAVDALQNGENIILTTSTASGKTLAFSLPVFERLGRDPGATALALYPTKALTNDQHKAFLAMEDGTGIRVRPSVYDGDTPRERRPRIRETARVLLSNPHELHHLLSWHHQWGRFLSGLEFVVIDEAHRYRGVFGSHVALLIRRLRRICRHYGSDPRFILSTATIANPREFAEKLCGVRCRVIDRDGSPHGQRTFILFNPFHDGCGSRSVHRDTSLLVARCVQHRLQTLCFAGSRKTAELVSMWAKEALSSERLGTPAQIASYRAGYLPGERRMVEEELKSGALRGVVSTNALELGIDIGSLDGVILSGFPGTMMSTWQQIGRAGRNCSESLALLVAFANPLDQYFMRHPDLLFRQSQEHAIIDLENPYILSGQVLCAAAELPLHPARDLEFFGPDLPAVIASQENEKLLCQTRRGYVYSGSRRTSDLVNLESISQETYRVMAGGRVLETMDRSHAFREAHKGAILLHQGQQYLVQSLDLDSRTIQATPVEVDYYTRPLKSVDIRIEHTLLQRDLAVGRLSFGDVLVTERYSAYKMLQHETTIGIEPLDLPPLRFSTRALWLQVPAGIAGEVEAHGEDFAGGLHGLEHVFIAMMPFHVLCDRWDIGGLSVPCGGDDGDPTVFVYDGYEGGIGLSEKAYARCEEILSTSRDLVSGCGCDRGCPSCIFSPKCGNDNQPLDKAATERLLHILAGDGVLQGPGAGRASGQGCTSG